MAIGFTNRGKIRMLELLLQGASPPGGFAIALVTDNIIPGPDTNLFGDLEEIVSGNGYNPGGVAISRDLVGFPTALEDDALDKGSITMKDVTFTATGGTLPASGDGVKFAVLTDNNATIENREVYGYAEFTGAAKIVADTGVLSVLGLKFSLTEPS